MAPLTRGDHNLRSSYGSCMLSLMQQLPAPLDPGSVRSVLDVGCATGLSSLALTELFPNAAVTGIDLSPHMVAVGRYHQQQREVRVCRVPCVFLPRAGVLALPACMPGCPLLITPPGPPLACASAPRPPVPSCRCRLSSARRQPAAARKN